MLSINPNSTVTAKALVGSPTPPPPGACTFKGKASAKEIKKIGQVINKLEIDSIIKSPRISNEEKKYILAHRVMSNFSQLNLFEKIKLLFKKSC